VPTTEARWVVEPFRTGAPEQFARLRELLEALGYTEREVCSRFGIDTIHQAIRRLEPDREVSDPQALLIRLFLETAPVPWRTVRALLTPGDLGAIEDLGLLMPPEVTGEVCRATLALYPTEGLYIASDHGEAGPVSDWQAPADIVFPAIGEATQRFIALMPRTPCGDMLDLCSGTGIAALVGASRFADRAWAVDITERSTRFAKFNAALNGIRTVSALTGDLYQPVEGQTFDRIVANPPYVPALNDEYIFRDGGEDGERVTWRILAGLAAHLQPGGTFYCDCVATDRDGAPLEVRIRRALGESDSEFDIVVAEAMTIDPTVYYARRAQHGEESFADVGRRHELFKKLGIRQLVSAPVLIRRRDDDDDRAPLTLRRQLSPFTRSRDLQWALDSQAALAGGQGAGRLLRSRLRANPRAEVRTIHRQHDGHWLLDRCFLVTQAPFVADASCPPGYATLFMLCDGKVTGRDLLQRLKEQGVVPDDAPELEFAEALRRLAEHGLLEIVESASEGEPAGE
jgi:methylase of polypeptide subunit release factors/transcriptional regulator with XRE-family HTH domain